MSHAADHDAPMDTPDWVRDAVFYQIFPDRFARSPRLPKPASLEPWEAPPMWRGYKGGDLYGVVEHLDHIEALGANAFYLTPIFQAASNHRYNTHDYYQVDPLLGGLPAFRELLVQMTYPGAPCVYYGDEIGLTGGHDPLNRQGLPWRRPESWNRELFAYTRRLIELRKQHAALRRGAYQTLYARDGVYVFARELSSERFVIALNVNRSPITLTFATAAFPHLRGEFHDALSECSAHADAREFTGPELPARSGAVFQWRRV
jgi:glycosidase